MKMSKIMLLDDKTEFLENMEDVLEDDYDLKCFSNPTEALKALGNEDFDFIISDIMMPGMHGIDFAQIARTIIGNSRIVFISANQKEEISTIGTIGDVDFFRKPLDDKFYDYLKSKVNSLDKEQSVSTVKNTGNFSEYITIYKTYNQLLEKYALASTKIGEFDGEISPLEVSKLKESLDLIRKVIGNDEKAQHELEKSFCNSWDISFNEKNLLKKVDLSWFEYPYLYKPRKNGQESIFIKTLKVSDCHIYINDERVDKGRYDMELSLLPASSTESEKLAFDTINLLCELDYMEKYYSSRAAGGIRNQLKNFMNSKHSYKIEFLDGIDFKTDKKGTSKLASIEKIYSPKDLDRYSHKFSDGKVIESNYCDFYGIVARIPPLNIKVTLEDKIMNLSVKENFDLDAYINNQQIELHNLDDDLITKDSPIEKAKYAMKYALDSFLG